MTTYETKKEVSAPQTITPKLLEKWLSTDNTDNPNAFKQYEVWLKTQTDPLATLSALKSAHDSKLIQLPHLAKAIASIGLRARQHGFSQSVVDQTDKQSKSWKEWLTWMETTLNTATEFPPPSANQLLTGLAALTENYYVIRPFKADAINALLNGLKTCGSLEEIRDGLNHLRVLADYQVVWNIAALDVDILDDLLNYTPQRKKEKKNDDKDVKTSHLANTNLEIVIRTQITRHITYLLLQMRVLSPGPKCIQIQSLINVLDQALKSSNKSAANLSLLLLAAGNILQAGRMNGGNETLQEKITEILIFLNEKDNVAKMSTSQLVAALYALVLPVPPGWRDLKPTENLVKHFFERLLTEQASPADLQQMAEYLCLTHKPLPEPIKNHLIKNRPFIDKNSLQHKFGEYLPLQHWFNKDYKVVEEEALLDNSYSHLDFIIRDRKTQEIINVEVDGRYHGGPSDDRRDDHLHQLIDPKTKKLVLKEICRVPVPRKPKGFWKPEEVLPLMADNLQRQLEKLKNTLSKPSTLPSILSDRKKPVIEAKKLPLPETTEEPSNTQGKKKKGKKKKLKKSVLDLKNELYQAIEAHNNEKINRLIERLRRRNALKNDISGDQEKADILLQAVNAANKVEEQHTKNSKAVITCLIKNFGSRIATTANAKGQSPLLHIIDANNKDILNFFIDTLKPKQDKEKSPDIYALWQQALQKATHENKDALITVLEQAEIVLPETTPLDSKPPVRPHASSTSQPGVVDQKTVQRNNKVDFLDDDEKTSSLLNPTTELCKNQQGDADWLEQLELLAENGYMQAQFILADHHWLLRNSEPDGPEHSKEAVKWWREAAKQGAPTAQYNLGACYSTGNGITKNQTEAVKWWGEAAKQGMPKAQYLLGTRYSTGNGITTNQTEAVRWWEKAAEQNHARAQYNLGQCYSAGNGVTKDETKAARWWKKAAEQNHARAQNNLGACYMGGMGVTKDPTKGAEWYLAAANQGVPDAEFNLGACYMGGIGVTKDPTKGAEWYLAAANQGVPDAEFNLGACYMGGIGVTKDLKEGAKWYLKAANQGFPDAQFKLGLCYELGVGVTNDEKEAVRLYRLAAEQGYAEAQYQLGMCCASGIGVTNKTEAVKWYRLAAEQGHTKAQLYYSTVCYSEGTGVEEDEKEAMKWLQQAAKQGNAGVQAVFKASGVDVDKDKKNPSPVSTLAPQLGSPIHSKNKKALTSSSQSTSSTPPVGNSSSSSSQSDFSPQTNSQR